MNWKKLGKRGFPGAESFLRERESYCVGAASRFIAGSGNRIWTAGKKEINALLLYSRRTLYPVFHFGEKSGTGWGNKRFPGKAIPLPLFFPILQIKQPLHAMQGLSGDLDMLEGDLKKKGFPEPVKYDYELRSLGDVQDAGQAGENPFPAALCQSPPELVIRSPGAEDLEALFPLQREYELEEVLPRGAVFNPAACRLGLERLLKEETVLAAELEGVLAGKININARSFTRLQIGGVYVLPQYRRRGIARALTAALIRKLSPLGKKFTLFVKKENLPARKVYDALGFTKIADYRINYYL
jgi:ribosomal protein S18 acetylase RimI-like enzyme